MGGEPKVDGRSTESRSNTSGRTVEHRPNTNRTPVGDQWESIEGQWEGNGRKIGKNVKKKENHQRNVKHLKHFCFGSSRKVCIFCSLRLRNSAAPQQLEQAPLRSTSCVPMVASDQRSSGTSFVNRNYQQL